MEGKASGLSSLLAEGAFWRQWLLEKALPLWHGAGWDPVNGLYHERLFQNGQPDEQAPRRLMVQARQIATYCHAVLDGLMPPAVAKQALAAFGRVRALYHAPDGQRGWIFSRTVAGQRQGAFDGRRDFYAHAFILYAHAMAGRVSQGSLQEALRLQAQTLVEDINQLFLAPPPGRGATAAALRPQPQNPLMHFLEALLACQESWESPSVTGSRFFTHWAGRIVAKCLDQMVRNVSSHGTSNQARNTGWLVLPEDFVGCNFNSPWRPSISWRVEPGHQVEWAWLLLKWLRLNPVRGGGGESTLRHQALVSAKRLALPWLEQAHFLPDAVTPTGAVMEAGQRLWPQTEKLRLLGTVLAEDPFPVAFPLKDTYSYQARAVRAAFLPDKLKGGWIDRLEQPAAFMPASSLYHIYGAARGLALL
ncbi:hypothetical protein E3E12_04660 [Formicincola oecophyllae]|uniref:Mannose-6-phosphate isomerase n=1 Tax=Formicincola oecophyllae TaxID=2558361 RepID=A0A4Y6UB28_9PROT|nr:AGE family epimerase/isomerase [Formicincola oecophyllae]QDH13601.1 hypothetical protein E3E12_04660 [Formicincola oecophyllae]